MISVKLMQKEPHSVRLSGGGNLKIRGGVKVSTGSLRCDKRAEERDFYKKRIF